MVDGDWWEKLDEVCKAAGYEAAWADKRLSMTEDWPVAYSLLSASGSLIDITHVPETGFYFLSFALHAQPLDCLIASEM